ncbi:TPA: RNA-splicing ligase RtcB [bacterium]|nr:RNA-splicing ligase RtcB [bacterium]
MQEIPLEKLDDYRFLLPKRFKPDMKVPGLIYASERMLPSIKADQSLIQVANVACLPGIVKYSIAMPDIHMGYGLPIGGVCATSIEEGGIVSPGGVGSDINCGVRLVATNLQAKDVKPKMEKLVSLLFEIIPSGLGSKGTIRVFGKEEENVLVEGAEWAVKKGYGWNEDLVATEEGGCFDLADPDMVSQRALERGGNQLGTLGSGNHFLEVQEVVEVYDEETAKAFSLFKGQITVMIHSGSRGLGYQVCEDYVKLMLEASRKYKIALPDKQLCCAPVESKEGKTYIGAMASAANYAWANRQCLMYLTRQAFSKFFGHSAKELGMELVYDVAHNIGKIETHNVDGQQKKVFVHRKGATRAFPKGHPEIGPKYKDVGQPVIVPGDMGRASYVLVGTEKGFNEVFGTTCHGAGRVLSRSSAIRRGRGRRIDQELKSKGIIVKSAGVETLAEEMSEAYKNVTEVVNIMAGSGICKKIVKMVPLGVIKG